MVILDAVKNFFPREEKFYHLLDDLTERACQSVHLLKQLIEVPGEDSIDSLGDEIAQCKSEAKKLREKITAEVCRTFITPFDREDIQELANVLYHIPKINEKLAERINTHGLRSQNRDLNRFADILDRQSQAMVELVKALNNGKNTKVIYQKAAVMHELEDQGDVLLGRVIAELFDRTNDIREVILRKDLYEMLEDVTDFYRDAANVVLGIMLKHS